MRKWMLAILALALLVPTLAAAQQGSLITIAPTPGVYVSPFVPASNEGVVNNQITTTITPPPGQYFYLTALEYSACSDATGTALTNGLFTQTGFQNLPINQLSLPVGSVNACAAVVNQNYDIYPIKSKTAGVAVTFVSPAGNLHVAYTYHAFGFFAP